MDLKLGESFLAKTLTIMPIWTASHDSVYKLGGAWDGVKDTRLCIDGRSQEYVCWLGIGLVDIYVV